MKPPRFLLSQNRLAKSDDVFIVHTRTPAFLARIITETPASDQLFSPIKRGGSIELIRIFEPDTDEAIQKILTQMAAWYNYTSKL